MLHEPLEDGNSIGVNTNAGFEGILLQLNDHEYGEQVRVRLSRNEADRLIVRLKELKSLVKPKKSLPCPQNR